MRVTGWRQRRAGQIKSAGVAAQISAKKEMQKAGRRVITGSGSD